MTFCKFWIVDLTYLIAEQLNWSHTQFVRVNFVRVNFTVTDDTIISRIGLLTTRWLKMKKIMAWVILAKEIWTKQIKKPTFGNLEKLMNVELLEKVANIIVKMVQLKWWFVTSWWQIGEIRPSQSEAHPLVLLKQSNISEAIIRWCYENVAHGGRGMT